MWIVEVNVAGRRFVHEVRARRPFIRWSSRSFGWRQSPRFKLGYHRGELRDAGVQHGGELCTQSFFNMGGVSHRSFSGPTAGDIANSDDYLLKILMCRNYGEPGHQR